MHRYIEQFVSAHCQLHLEIECSAVAQISEDGATRHFSSLLIDRSLDLSHHGASSLLDFRLTQTKRKRNRRTTHPAFLKGGIEPHSQGTLGRAPVSQHIRHLGQSSKLLISSIVILERFDNFVDSCLGFLFRDQ